MARALAKQTPADIVKSNLEEMVKSLPGGPASIARFKQAAMGVAMSPGIQGCEPRSVAKCVFACARLNLIPDPIRHLVAIVPFRNKGVKEAQIIMEYRGIITLAKRADPGISINAGTVYENDEYELLRGTENRLTISKQWWETGKDSPGKPKFFYCVAKQRDGAPTLTVIPAQEARELGSNSKAGDAPGTPWHDHFERMGEKTAIKRDSRFWHLDPDSDVTRQFREALEYDENDADEIPAVDLGEEGEEFPEEGTTKKKRKVKKAEAKVTDIPPKEEAQPTETEDDGNGPATEDDYKILEMVVGLKLSELDIEENEDNRSLVIADAAGDLPIDASTTRNQIKELIKIVKSTKSEVIAKLFE